MKDKKKKKVSTQLTADPETLLLYGVDTEENDQKHFLYDPRVLNKPDPDITKSIGEFGVIQPVTVVRDGEHLFVADGRQRVINAREWNRRVASGEVDGIAVRVPYIVKSMGEEKASTIATILNHHRVLDSTIQRAQLAQRLRDAGRDDEEIAYMMHTTVATIKSWDALMNTSDRIRSDVEKGELSVSAALVLAGLPKNEQEEVLDSNNAREVITKRAAELMVARNQKAKKSADDSSSEDSDKYTPVVPTKALLRKIVEYCSENTTTIPYPFLDGLQFVLGTLRAKKVRGLTKVLRELDPGKDTEGDEKDD